MNSKGYKKKINNKDYINYLLNSAKINKNKIKDESLKSILLNSRNNSNQCLYPIYSNNNSNKYLLNENNITNNNKIIEKKTINIKQTDPRLILCIKELGITKYYSNFTQNILNFEDFLSLTKEEMNNMKIPKNIQNLVKNFSLDYINSESSYSLDALKDYFYNKISLINSNKLEKNLEGMSFSFDSNCENFPKNQKMYK